MTHAFADVTVPTETTLQLQCMEIWGGMEAANEYVAVPGLDVWVYARPYADSRSGGDIHYLSLCGGGNISRFMVADVSGHGQEISQVAHHFRKLMRKYINTPNQARFAQSLNEAFGSEATEGRFVTALIATYFAPTDHLIVVNAGHPRPLYYSAEHDRWTLLDEQAPCCADQCSGIRNLPLGVIAETAYRQFAVELAKGDMAVIYTDSLIEATNGSDRQLGESGLLAMVREHGTGEPDALGRRLLEAVAAYRGGGPADDDLTLIVLHHNAADPPAHSLGEWIRVMARMTGLVKV